MFFAESWLRSYIDPQLSTAELAETLTMSGLEVESVTPVAPPFTGVVVARVLTCVPHENSDHLHVCTVDAGTGEILQVVCGAPNVAAGVKAPCALVGAVLPGGFKIKKARMRGVASFGMLCSARELGVSEDHSGIWLLPEDAPVGEDIRRYANLDDQRFEIKLTPNRGDALSVVGVARDLHAVTGAELKLPVFRPVSPNSEIRKNVTIQDSDLCGRFTGRVIRGLDNHAPTPQWMKDRLERAGQRPISALVDISNYVMLELGRPSHFFDLGKLHGDMTMRWAKEGEKLELLNGMVVDLTPWYGVVCDETGPVALSGIMGGESSIIEEGTTDLFIEAAFWYPQAIQGRCRRLNFSTDAAHNFERGVDWSTNVDHMEYLTGLVLSICGTPETEIGPVNDVIARLPESPRVRMRPARCRKVIGVEIPESFMEGAFKRLGFRVERDGGDFLVMPPAFRFDINIEEDLIEEVVRLWGMDRLPDLPPLARMPMKSHPEASRSQHSLRRTLVSLGYQELVNFSFIEEKWEQDFAGNSNPIRLLNPIASELSVMRTQLIGGLVDKLCYNLNRKAEDIRIFELAKVFFRDPTVEDSDLTVKGTRQPVHIAGLAYGDARGSQWGEAKRPVDFFDVKGDVEKLMSPLAGEFRAAQHPAFHPGRSASVLLEGRVVGFVGELHPRLCHKYGLPKAPVIFELEAGPLLSVPVPSPKPVSKFQPLSRDISVTVPRNVTAAEIFAAVDKIRASDRAGSVIESFRLFDLYRQKGNPDALQSMAFRITLSQAGGEAVTEQQADEAVAAIVSALDAVGVHLRS